MRTAWNSITFPMMSAQSVEVPDGNFGYFNGVTAIQRLPGENLGSTTITLTNVVVGSRVRLELQSTGATVDERVSTGSTEVFTVPYYPLGDAANDLRIKVRKGTAAPFYQPWETLAVAGVNPQSIYVAQVPDE